MIADYFMTKHAAGRALDMLVTVEEIRTALIRPEVVYTQPWRGENCQIRQAGRIALALRGRMVCSVLYRKTECWSRDDLELALKSAESVA